ncbi:sulfotransferase family 2 domain-containing protein [Vibrio hippocampi]|uniref:Sulfotransferase family protein n=1 Tax=Vibrio hippocampi TaxID=654686 RepID=A0ABM8ZL89_9VIBR|nr:sulfotransferase family 2 domain-containing protein [Vibrio hippocampi]CAH0529062.1 hypothetical protein VHP8226_03031 [Vibrio hippocampi]
MRAIMISHEHRCIFIHIPKCAGTSVETVFGHLDGHQGRGAQDHRSMRMLEQPWLRFQSFRSRENIEELLRRQKNKYMFQSHNQKNKMELSREQYESYYKFSIVRDPWDRALSWYKNVIRDEHHLRQLRVSADISFKEFMCRFAGKGLLRPQVYWLKNFAGDVELDHVGKFENLADDMQRVFNDLGMSNTVLPHKIKGTGSNNDALMCDETRALISKVYREDIELFGYANK